jgi:hypothetical protein
VRTTADIRIAMLSIRRVVVLLLTLAFLAGLATQSVAFGSMATAVRSAANMPGHSAKPEKPCEDSAPCADHPGCVVLAALPATPGAAPVPVNWAFIEYRELASALTGHFVEPELSPPILTA